MNFISRLGLQTLKNVTRTNARAMSSARKGNTDTREYERIPREQEDETILKQEILRSALNYVNTTGWSMNTIRAGAEDTYEAGELSEIFLEYDLVRFFLTNANDELENHLAANPVSVEAALEYRLRKVVPYVPRFNEALAYATSPENVSESMRLLLHLADSIAHHSMKDVSTDISWYTKRLGIASIYVSSELCLLQDESENYIETFEFMKRRVSDFKNLGAGNLTPFAIPLPDILTAGFSTAMNILGRNSRR